MNNFLRMLLVLACFLSGNNILGMKSAPRKPSNSDKGSSSAAPGKTPGTGTRPVIDQGKQQEKAAALLTAVNSLDLKTLECFLENYKPNPQLLTGALCCALSKELDRELDLQGVEKCAKTVELLLQAGANANARYQVEPYSVLRKALLTKNLPAVKLLLEHGAKVTAKDNRNTTDFSYAYADFLLKKNKEREEIMESMFSYGAKEPQLLLDEIQCYDVTTVQLLLKHGAEVSEAALKAARALSIEGDKKAEIIKMLQRKANGEACIIM